jgi:hypothetical protein
MAGELRTGWPVVAACFATAVFAWGFAAYGPAVYVAELQRQHGWSAAAIGGATTVAFILAAGLLPWTSAAIGRLGQVGYSLSPPLLGIVRDLTGGYRPVLGICVGLQLVATCLVLVGPIKRRLARQQRKVAKWE